MPATQSEVRTILVLHDQTVQVQNPENSRYTLLKNFNDYYRRKRVLRRTVTEDSFILTFARELVAANHLEENNYEVVTRNSYILGDWSVTQINILPK